MAEFVVRVLVDDSKLRMMVEGQLEDRLADGAALTPVEQVERELLDGWANEVADYAARIWPHMMQASFSVRLLQQQPDGVHTIPVPHGWSAEQAWEAIARGEALTDPDPMWANVVVKDGRFVRLVEVD